MSELMDRAILMMPFDLAMNSELSRSQFYFRAQTVMADRDELLGLLRDIRNWDSAKWEAAIPRIDAALANLEVKS